MSAARVMTVLKMFMSEAQMDEGIEEMKTNMISDIEDRRHFVMYRKPITSLKECKHQQWFLKWFEGSKFCKACLEYKRRRED